MEILLEKEKEEENFQELKKGFQKFFNSLSEEENLIRFFERNGAYYVHGKNALFVAQEFYNSLQGIKYWGTNNNNEIFNSPYKKLKKDFNNNNDNELLEYLIIREGIEFSSLLKLLLEKQCRIEIWKNSSSKLNNWNIFKKGSPGNINDLEEWLFNEYEGSSQSILTLAIYFEILQNEKIIGISIIDIMMRKFIVCEFPDDEKFSNLESVIVQTGVKECIIGNSSLYLEKIKNICEKCNVALVTIKPYDFIKKEEILQHDLNNLLKVPIQNCVEFTLKRSMIACGYLYKYFELLNNPYNFKSYAICSFNFQQYMKLNASVVSSLNLLPEDKSSFTKSSNLFGLLNQCKTSMGSRKLMEWIRLPLIDINMIKKRHDLIENFLTEPLIISNLRDNYLKKIPDLDRLTKRLIQRKASLYDCYILYKCILILFEMNQLFHSFSEKKIIQLEFLNPLQTLINNFEDYVKLIEKTIDLKIAEEQNEYIIQPSYHIELQKYAEERKEIFEKIQSHWQDVANELKIVKEKTLKLEKNKLGWHFRLSKKEEKHIHKQSKFFQIEPTRKDGIRFRDNKLEKLNKRLTEMSQLYEQKQLDLVTNLIENIVKKELIFIETASSLISEIDVILSFSYFIVNSPNKYIRPQMTRLGEGDIILKESRHPFVEIQNNINFISNDVQLLREQSSFVIITGPNMGGKSTYIKQIGLIILMAQIGFFVPCSEAYICIVDSIITRIGANDCQMRGISTFMFEMLEISFILKNATNNSLIIIDELGRGTSTADGYGLARAIAEDICKRIKAFCLFATHFHELTTLEYLIPCIYNVHMDAVMEEGELILLYKVVDGPCDKSFGIHIAEMTKFPPNIIELAKLKAKQLENFNTTTSEITYNPDEKEKLHILYNFLNNLKNDNISRYMEKPILIEKLKEWKEILKNLL